jgi:PhnB protein
MSKVQAIPTGMHSVTPHLVCAGGADAIAFYIKAFGAVEVGRFAGPDGRLMHGCIRINGSSVMLVDEFAEHGSLSPKSLKGSPVTIHLYVEDADAFFAKAVAAGARAIMPVTEMFWGDRYGMIEDPFGHQWAIATHVRDVAYEDLPKAMADAPPPPCPDAAAG